MKKRVLGLRIELDKLRSATPAPRRSIKPLPLGITGKERRKYKHAKGGKREHRDRGYGGRMQ